MKYLIKNIDNLSQNLFKELSLVHRYLYKHPELGRQEYQTSEYIRNKIVEIGNLKITMLGKMGFTADLVQSKSYPRLIPKTDMDAIPRKDGPCKSIN